MPTGLLTRLSLCGILLCALPVRADLRARIDALLGPAAKQKVSIAARVVALPQGEVLYSFRADEPMKPASNMKLLTSAASLDRLGASFAFETVLARWGDDLVVIGGGDPATGDPRLAARAGEDRLALFDRWTEMLAAAGLTEVRGSLVLDASLFDDRLVHPSWPEDQLQQWYAAPVAGLNINDNCIDVTVRPGAGAGQPAEFAVWPPNGWVRIENRTVTGGRGFPTIGRLGRSPRYLLSGSCGRSGALQSVAVPDPVELFADSLRTRLRSRGISVRGPTVRRRVADARGGVPSDCTVLHRARTPLTVVLGRCNQNSQNLFAECLFKRLGLAESLADPRPGLDRPQGSWPAGQRAVRRFLSSLGLEDERTVIDDGSGLSHENRLSARVLTEVLGHMFGRSDREVFVASLTTPGGEGTFGKRLYELEGRLFVKTGTIRGVNALSGYVRSAEGGWLCFSLLINDIPGSSAAHRQLQDAFCRLLAGSWRPQTEPPSEPPVTDARVAP